MAQSLSSPCIGLCVLEPSTGLCRGCFRTMAEIGSWPTLDDDGRREVLARVAERRSRAGE